MTTNRKLRTATIRRIAAATLFACAATLANAAVTIDLSGPYSDMNGYASGGFHSTAEGSAWIGNSNSCGPSCPFNGGSYVLSLGAAITFSADDDTLFSLSQFDGAEAHGNTAWIWAKSIRVVGVRGDNSTVSTDILLDGIDDGAGPLQDFQTFMLGADYTGLRSVTFSGVGGSFNYYTLDNLVFNGAPSQADTTVPEPGSLALVAVALLAAGGTASRRQAIKKG